MATIEVPKAAHTLQKIKKFEKTNQNQTFFGLVYCSSKYFFNFSSLLLLLLLVVVVAKTASIPKFASTLNNRNPFQTNKVWI